MMTDWVYDEERNKTYCSFTCVKKKTGIGSMWEVRGRFSAMDAQELDSYKHPCNSCGTYYSGDGRGKDKSYD